MACPVHTVFEAFEAYQSLTCHLCYLQIDRVKEAGSMAGLSVGSDPRVPVH